MTKVADPTRIPHQSDPAPGRQDPMPGAQPTARKPALATGQRPLTATEQAQRQLAVSCVAPDKTQATAGCSQVLEFTVFFDGTGNNRDQEMAKATDKRALSNIAKLFAAHEPQLSGRRIVRYIPGVGTPFPTIGDSGGTLGMGIGKGSDQRIRYALDELDKAIAAVPAGVKLRLITVNVFGFSRGAAAARAFVRDLAARCQTGNGGNTYQGIPLRVGFLGIFDTVCSAYENAGQAAVSTGGGHNGWAHDMRLPMLVEQCVHLTAGHEVRRRFPLDSVRIGAHYPQNAYEVSYPGVHADVGGGTPPMSRGCITPCRALR